MESQDCWAYTSWPSSLTGYPTVIECEPRGPPGEALDDVATLLYLLTGDPLEGREKERIGGKYIVHKAYSGDRKTPRWEARVVELDGKTIWAGGASKTPKPGLPSEPHRSPPALERPWTLDPPPNPPGQKMIRKPVVYSAEGGPGKGPDRIVIGRYTPGGPEPAYTIGVSDLEAGEYRYDFHCVTGWSVGGLRWTGVPLLDLLEDAGLRGSWVVAVSAGGYASVFPFDEDVLDGAIVAVGLEGDPLPGEHGGPARLVIPRLYGWKHVKWLAGVFVGDVYLDGYWEARGYHWRGLVALEERFKSLV